MMEKWNYISDEELEHLMLQVEQEELVAAPPDLMENILARTEAAQKREFYAYCFRVITSVAAAVALVFLLPGLTERIAEKQDSSEPARTVYLQVIPSYEDVVAPVPEKSDVVAQATRSKEEVLNKTGLIEKVLNSSGWFDKKSNKK